MTTRPLDDACLDALRQRGDPDADSVAARLVEKHPGLDEVDLVRRVLSQMSHRSDADDAWVRDWIIHGPPLPPWVDPALVAQGQRFFGDWLLAITGSLFCVSLPSAYASADGAQVLRRTSPLATGQITRRTAETGQMLVDVMDLGNESPASLQPGGQGYLSARGVRLLHAVVRQTLLAGSLVTRDDGRIGGWPPEWGVPVNQEDLLGTLLTFTTAVFHGMDRLGIPYDPADAEAYVHTWCVVGHLLGIDPPLLPFDRAFGEQLAETIARRHHRPSDAGDQLMTAHLRQMELSMPWGFMRVPRTLIRHMLGPEIPDILRVPRAAWWRPALTALAAVGPAVGRLPGGARVMQAPSTLIGRSMMRSYIDQALGQERPAFRLDERAVHRLSLRRSRGGLRRARRRSRAALHRPPAMSSNSRDQVEVTS
jgi:hypothetical protein